LLKSKFILLLYQNPSKIEIRFNFFIITNDTTMTKVKVRFIVLEEGEFLYEEKTLNVYNCLPPHKYIGKIDLSLFKIVK
jgi:hypothetical protein